MSLSKSKCWYSNNSLQFLKHAIPFFAKIKEASRVLRQQCNLLLPSSRNLLQSTIFSTKCKFKLCFHWQSLLAKTVGSIVPWLRLPYLPWPHSTNRIISFGIVLHRWSRPGNPYWRGRLSTVDLLALTSLDQQLFTLRILFTFFTNQATSTRRSTVLSLFPQLVFPAKAGRVARYCWWFPIVCGEVPCLKLNLF